MSDTAIVHGGKKSWVQEFYERARGVVVAAPPSSPMTYVRATGSAVGEYALAGGLGAILGATHARFGLDTKAGPIDGWISGLGFAAGVALAGIAPTAASYAMRTGANAFNILTFRKSFELLRGEPYGGHRVERLSAPSRGAAMAGEDNILKVAERLG